MQLEETQLKESRQGRGLGSFPRLRSQLEEEGREGSERYLRRGWEALLGIKTKR
jgi:hypothetical protein